MPGVQAREQNRKRCQLSSFAEYEEKFETSRRFDPLNRPTMRDFGLFCTLLRVSGCMPLLAPTAAWHYDLAALAIAIFWTAMCGVPGALSFAARAELTSSQAWQLEIPQFVVIIPATL